MIQEHRKIETIINWLVSKPLAWILHGGWLVFVGLAVATVWVHRKVLRRGASLAEKS